MLTFGKEEWCTGAVYEKKLFGTKASEELIEHSIAAEMDLPRTWLQWCRVLTNETSLSRCCSTWLTRYLPTYPNCLRLCYYSVPVPSSLSSCVSFRRVACMCLSYLTTTQPAGCVCSSSSSSSAFPFRGSTVRRIFNKGKFALMGRFRDDAMDSRCFNVLLQAWISSTTTLRKWSATGPVCGGRPAGLFSRRSSWP